MHEFSLATQVFENVFEYSEFHEGRDVQKIHLALGEWMGVDAAQLRFCYDSIKQLTPLRNSSLDIEIVPGQDCAITSLEFQQTAGPSPAPVHAYHEHDSFRPAVPAKA